MTAQLFIFALLILVTDQHARGNGKWDALMIRVGEEIKHAKRLKIRVVGMGIIASIAFGFWCIAAALWGFSVWSGLFLFPAVWAWWTMRFRWVLNRERGLDWRYVSPSNWYDWQFIRHMLGWSKLSRKNAMEDHKHTYHAGDFPLYRRNIHRAGILAYIVESLVFIGSVAGMFFT